MANESYGSIIHNGVNYSLGSGVNSANKTDISSIILTGTTNTSGSTITAGTWFYLNGELVRAKVDIASNATFTLDTNYEKKTVGDELIELNSNIPTAFRRRLVTPESTDEWVKAGSSMTLSSHSLVLCYGSYYNQPITGIKITEKDTQRVLAIDDNNKIHNYTHSLVYYMGSDNPVDVDVYRNGPTGASDYVDVLVVNYFGGIK